MKREEIKGIFGDVTPQQLDAVMEINGADIEREKAKAIQTEASLRQHIADLQSQLDAIGAEEERKAQEAEQERALKEKRDSVERRFNSALNGKQFTHNAIRAFYLQKFAKALDSGDFDGMSDIDIIGRLTEDDCEAFRGVTVVKLAGGEPSYAPAYSSKDEIMAIADRNARRRAIAENPELFGITNKGE